ncbi:hypothetical protein [Paraburkholderia dinghuensis]|uniref:Uncharacterized protein n=1 Tax=Paraburkholderia dinghuensis TaxID=2305225 RepID=A0A3N6PRY5_9BURK|nr:hypothetical protein [Paraburkholderia dinghuensis]RQH04690.1 hypothetical protein D1Y85_17530 [Paraburkholderia dinghuensis]
MLRWVIPLLILANSAAAAANAGVFGPTPASGLRDSAPLTRQIHPERLTVRPIVASESVDVPVVGGPVSDPAVQTAPLTQ